ncbi:MAG: cohesin domain-containing protein [Acidobacteriota bacterium]|nr:cohesin domain-containing protein [Acidobacteriota bacterium]
MLTPFLIADDTRQKRAEYADQVIRTFYLSNAETKQVQTLVRALLETRRIHENQDLNAITIKDTPEVIKIAERVIKANDKAKGEVVVDLELLEINRNKLQRLGLDLSSKSLSLVFGDGGESLTLNALDALKSKAAWAVGPVPSVLLNFLKTDSDSKSIAKPQLRILEGEDGKITIGDRVPIPATTFNTSQTIGGNVVPITSFTYQNVGIIVDVKPRVHHNKEITLELKLEISSLSGTVEGTGGVSQPIIGTRTIETTIRLKDGETNLLAGLIKQDERSSLSGIPGLSDIPFLRRIFGANEDASQTTDIVMAVTPHILRVPNIEPIDLVPLWVGTEERLQLRGVARNALGESPFEGKSPWDEIEKELSGEEPTGYEEGAPRVKLDAEESGRVEAGAEEAAPRRKRRRRSEPEALPDDGVFDADQPDVDLEGGKSDSTVEARKEVEDQPRRPAVAQVRMAADRTRVAAGEAFGVEMVVSGAENVGQVNFQLRYDPAVLRFVPPAEPGSFLQQGGVRVDLQAVESAEGGLIVVSAARAGDVGASGSGGLVRLNFIALAPGEAGFTISAASVRSPDSRAQPASFRRTSVEVTP